MFEPSLKFYLWTVCYILVAVGLTSYGLHRYFIIYLYQKHKKKPPQPQSYFKKLPRVTVQLPIYNEYYVVKRLIKSVAQLDYPKNLLEIQVLDDSTDSTSKIAKQEVECLVKAGFNANYIHRNNRRGFKAGALEEGMAKASGEFIFILDADFVPTPGILHQAIHYFTDPKIGMIQTRWGHLNRSYSLLTRVQAMFLDGHLLLEQTARSRSGRFFNFNGTAGIWRKSCIENAGGWQHDTLTEDLDLSYRAQLAGWRFLFLPELVTPAELPVNMNGFKSQQHRWTKGSIQTCKKLLPTIWKSDFPLGIKLEATAHLTSNFAYILLLGLCILLHPSFNCVEPGAWRTLIFDFPVFIAGSTSVIVFYCYSQREVQPKTWVREIVLMPLLISIGIGLAINNAKGVLEAVFNHQSEFTRTPKYGIDDRRQDWRNSCYYPLKNLLPLIELAFACYFAYFVYYAIIQHQWTTLPFVLLFQFGFIYVAFSSLSQWLQLRRNSESPEPVEGTEAIPSA